VGPWIRVNITTSRKVTSKIRWASARPAVIGNVASTMGTAPRRPAQETNACSRSGIPNGVAHNRTEIGRATNVSATPTTRAGSSASPSRAGEASRPRTTNRPIWDSQARPSAKPRVALWWGRPAFPSNSPATYAATNGLPPATPAAPNPSSAKASVAKG
jgi:hypothetical protein